MQGELVIQTKHETKKILSIETWTDAFIVFMSIYCSLHTQQYPILLKYMNIIRLAAKRCCDIGWKTYDGQFRLHKSQDPTSSWDSIDSVLWLLHISNSQPVRTPNFRQGLQNVHLKCYAFNYNGHCSKSPCYFCPNCLKCNGEHPSIYCSSFNQAQNNGSNQFRAPFRPIGRSPNVVGYQNFHFRQLVMHRPRNPRTVVGPRQNAH